jgi:Protein of unknown function (DUF1588)/Protein of unknown function (DUF1592)/Protein of unknown function (DUF1595)/Protein of unknown function (DUF1585)/Protein of unknown function (DUF1587)
MHLRDIPLSGNSFKRGVASSVRTGVRAFGIASVLACLGACSGTISDTHGAGGNNPGGVGGPGSTLAGGNGTGSGTGATGFVCPANTVEPGPAPLRLLTQEQYLNTVHDLFGDIAQLDTVFDRSGASVFGLQQGDVSQVALEAYQKAAEIIGTATVSNATKLKTLAPCATGADKRGCARAFVQTFGALAYRAPVVDAADIDRHLAVYDVGASTSHEHGVELVLRSMLQSARFLYRVELGTAEKVAPNAVKLSGYELAARLSYALWDTMPDAKLTTSAASGGLSTKEGAASALQSMVADPRGAKVVRRFLEQLIRLGELDRLTKDTQLFPDWNDALRTTMTGQAQTFFDDVLGNQHGSLSSLFTASTSANASGMLTLPALLSTLAKPDESSPIYRGKFVREELLCELLPPPPPNVPKPPDTQPGVTTREKFKQHEVDPACSGCHSLMDPIGLGFENYDALGRYRTMDSGRAVDASGEVSGTSDMDGKFNGVPELGKKLAGSAEVETCVARQWFRFFLDRFEQDADNCSMKALIDAFKAQGSDLNGLPQALVQTDAFLYRRPVN